MTKEKTALQQAIEKIDYQISVHESIGTTESKSQLRAFNYVANLLNEHLLSVERKQIEKAWQAGRYSGQSKLDGKTKEGYFTDTYIHE